MNLLNPYKALTEMIKANLPYKSYPIIELVNFYFKDRQI
jgi:hypothetical protein